jgi:predicted nucleic acid-binding Zn ribbon protein
MATLDAPGPPASRRKRMPRYDYRCTKCSKTLDVEKRMADPDPRFHLSNVDAELDGQSVECGGELEQVLSAAVIKFKGRGWHVTDYGKGK